MAGLGNNREQKTGYRGANYLQIVFIRRGCGCGGSNGVAGFGLLTQLI